jgi:transcriptional regulator with XRE-family HTH domain
MMADNIKTRRKSLGWSQYKLAEESKLSQCYISQLERGDKNPTRGAIESLANALGLTLGEMMGEGGSNENNENGHAGD